MKAVQKKQMCNIWNISETAVAQNVRKCLSMHFT